MKKEYYIYIFLLITPLIKGLYFEYSFCFANVFLLLILMYLAFVNKKLYIRKSNYIYLLGLLPMTYVFTSIFAIDRGMNPYGIMKVLEPLLFYLVLTQFDLEEEKVINILSISGAIMALVSILSLYSSVPEMLVQNNRMGGFFNYANTNGLYLLASLLLLQKSSWNHHIKIASSVLLLVGIILTYSRGIYLLGIVAACYLVMSHADTAKGYMRREWKQMSACIGLSVLLYLIVTNTTMITTNVRTGETELTARLLYYIDAVKIIASNLLGLGYDGYYFVQGAYQTGVYKVRLVHNSILQIALEIGVLGAIAYIGVLVIYIKRQAKGIFNLVFWLIVVHSLWDFDLSFLVISNILIWIVCVSEKNVAKFEISKRTVFIAFGAVLIGMNVMLGMSSLLYYMGYYDCSLKSYPANTEALGQKVKELFLEGKFNDSKKYIEKVYKLNSNDIGILTIERDIYINQKNWSMALKTQKNIVELDGINIIEVEKYSDLLLEIIINKGYNVKERIECKKELLDIRNYVNEKKKGISNLAYKQKRVPILLMTKKLLENEEEAKKY